MGIEIRVRVKIWNKFYLPHKKYMRSKADKSTPEKVPHFHKYIIFMELQNKDIQYAVKSTEVRSCH